jgi:DNA-binding CsgD family transcriptional regulator
MKPQKLSKNEKEIMYLVNKGLRSKDIARERGLNPKTVATYKRRIKIKLGIPLESNDYLLVKTWLKVYYPV